MDLSNVPFFQRPMSASKTDKPTGNMDEAGNVEYISKTGQTYFIKPSADQRTTRTKIEEDVAPAVKDFVANPSLPSGEQMKQFGIDAVQGTYEGIKGAVEGTGTMGDVFGAVPAMAALGAGAEVPEGAIRLFGGKKASSPGQTRSGANAPESVGADTMYRFEIDDSSSYVLPSNIKAIDSQDLTVFPDSAPTTLVDAFVHDELFFQYPELKNLGFVSDTSLGSGTYGYYVPNKNLIAINPTLLQPENADLLRKTLLHEVQHALQHREGFVQGTSPEGIEVAMVGPKLINSPENKADWDNYEQQIKKFEDPKNLEFTLQKISDLATAIAEKEGYQISEPGFFQRLKNKFLGGKELSIAEQSLIKFSNELNFLREKAANSDPKYFNYYLGRLDSLFSGVKSLAGPKSEGVFQEVLGLSPAELKNKRGSNLFLEIPKLPDLPAPGTTQAEDWVFHTIYQRKKGEAEARNASERMDLSLEERFNQTPESTEDVPRNLQWDESTYSPSQGSPQPSQVQSSNTSVAEIRDYNARVRKPSGLLDRDTVNKNDNILYRPDRSYRFIGRGGFEDFQSSGLIRARQDSKQGYEVPYFMKGKSSSRYGQGESGEYLVETVPTGDWKNAASTDDKYHGPTNPLTREGPIRIFKRNESGEFEVVFDNIGDEALLTNLEPKRFNQGGSVSMDKQMKLFQEGGIADDGMSRDPVSGNEIPPGSLASEVRDDVDAKLSEGEYVVPADVVRFFGVDYFEKLRKKAKEGLSEMDADGRIGGEPFPEDEEDDLPFSDEELSFLEDEEGTVEMAEGGMVTGFSQGFEQEMSSPTVQTEVYRNAEGEQRTIMFVNGQPIQKIPVGFTKAPKDSLTETPKDAKVENREANREGGMSTDATNSGFGNETGVATGGFADPFSGAVSGVGSAIGGAFGGGNEGSSGGPSAGASANGPNGGMGGYASRGMLVNKKVTQKQNPKTSQKSLVRKKSKQQ